MLLSSASRPVVSFVLASLLFYAQVGSAQERVLLVKSVEAEPYTIAFQGFQEALASTGHKFTLQEYLLKDGDGTRQKVLAEIRDRRPSLILTLGSTATAFARGNIKDIPVVFCMVLNPVASGFIQALHSSGNNLTGASLDIPPRIQFETFKAVVPSIKRVGVFYNRRDTGEVVEQAARAAKELGLELTAIPVSSSEELQVAVRDLDKKIDALWAVADSTVFASDRSTEFLLRKTLEYKIPFMGLSPAFVKAGALLSLAVDYKDVGRQCGEMAAQVLAGHPPNSLPIAVPRKVTLHLNLTVAKALGVSVPPRVLQDAVILR